MTNTVEHASSGEMPGQTDPRTVGVAIEAKLREWNISYSYVPDLPIDQVVILTDAQVREASHIADPKTVESYATQMREGDIFPPIIIHGDRLLLDGNTRLQASKRLRRRTIPAFLCHFSNVDLGRTFAAAMNQRNGVRLTSAEAAQAALTLIRFGFTEEAIAREVGFSATQVANWRRERDFSERADRTGISGSVATVAKKDQHKLARIVQEAPFARAAELVAEIRPKASQVNELVKAVMGAPSEAEAIEVVAEYKDEWKVAGPPPHRATLSKEMKTARMAVPALLGLAGNPLALYEQDPALRPGWVTKWTQLQQLCGEVVRVHEG